MPPSSLRSNRIVEAQSGIVKLAFLKMSTHKWKKNLGKQRELLAKLNRNLMDQHVISDFFKPPTEVTIATAFFIAMLDGCDANGQSKVTQIYICVPHPDLDGSLYIKSVSEFLKLYDQPIITQTDGAWTMLKEQAKTKHEND
jgi:hypothetical protein